MPRRPLRPPSKRDSSSFFSRLPTGRRFSCAGAQRGVRWPGRMDTNLYLVGFMGTGKSTVGRQLARQMGFEFIDSDHEIERRQGKPVSQIFAEEGEARFRALEREFIEHGHPTKKCVVSCGGGLVVPP